jgi:DNA-binding NtrC family response regulator
MSRERILIVDDHDSLRRAMTRALRETGLDVDEAANGNAAIEQLHGGQFDVVVCDLKMGGSDGLDVLRTAKAIHPATAVILMTAFGSVQTAVEVRRLKHEIDYLRHTQPDIYDFERIVGASGALQRVLGIVRKVAKPNTTVLIRGETDTGKELIAGALHHNSLRASRNFVRANCAALQENLLESELFGHEKGAFTGADRQRIGRFEQADGGSLFLDEVGDMSPNTQAKILRVLSGAGVRAAWRHPHNQRRCPGAHGDKPQSGRDGVHRRIPRGPVLPTQRHGSRRSGAARAKGGHPAAGLYLHTPVQRRASKDSHRDRTGRRKAATSSQLARQHSRVGERYRTGGAAGRR